MGESQFLLVNEVEGSFQNVKKENDGEKHKIIKSLIKF